MKKTLLENAFKEKSLIGIRTNSIEWDESIIGFIVGLEDSFFTINEIDEYGLFIGNTIIAIEDVVNIEIGDRYQIRLRFIYENSSKLKPNNRITIWKEGAELVSHFKTLIENKIITTLYFDEDYYVIGIILNFDGNSIMIKNIGSEGDDDGMSCYPISKIIGLRYDGIEEQKIKLLYENRASFYKK
jgi:hypothetical protein